MPNAAHLHEPYDTPEQQREAATLGMWVFLGTEIMLFGAMIMGFCAYRISYAQAFTEASHHTDLLLGTANTAVLLTSSLTMALAVRSAQLGSRKWLTGLLFGTMGLGIVFLVLKIAEWIEHYQHHLLPGAGFVFPGPHSATAELFFYFYFLLTGIHALHLTIGCGVMAVLAILAWRGKFTPAYTNPVEIGGLYWHLVDIVWIFLYPLLYLAGHH
ncbi:MAG TPA: cytochrome c oxidase subunit 3 family protein [Oscillatoriaceae cyanobacterium]